MSSPIYVDFTSCRVLLSTVREIRDAGAGKTKLVLATVDDKAEERTLDLPYTTAVTSLTKAQAECRRWGRG